MEPKPPQRTKPLVRSQSLIDLYVLISMALVALAVGVCLFLQVGTAFWVALVAGLLVYAGLFAVHSMMRNQPDATSLESEVGRLEREVQRLKSMPKVAVDAKQRVPAAQDMLASTGPTLDVSPPGVAGRVDADLRHDEPAQDVVAPPVLSSTLTVPVENTAVDGASDQSEDQAIVMPPREADVEMIQALIKKLADEVNENEAGLRAEPELPVSETVTEEAIAGSVDALRTAAGTMRQFEPDGAPAVSTNQPSPTVPPPVSSYHNRMALLADAIGAGRIDVLLDPILGLDDQRARHFEVSLRLRSAEGEILDLVSEGDDFAGTGLNLLLDRERLSRCSQIALRFSDRGRDSALFSDVTSEALVADAFHGDVVAAYQTREDFAGQLVMTFSQSDVGAFGVREWAMLSELQTLGFRFALSDVCTLDMDFDKLRQHGFDFAKLDAEVFLKGLPHEGAEVPAADICKYFAELGLTLIVGHIDDDMVLAQIFGFGVLFGQGRHFGGPRPAASQHQRSHQSDHVAA